jgi:hypothetical protein
MPDTIPPSMPTLLKGETEQSATPLGFPGHSFERQYRYIAQQ